MRVLIIGSGGREHALADAIAPSPLLSALFVAPGNPGMKTLAECVAVDISDHDAIIAFSLEAKIDLVVIGPEAPLVAGLADDLEAAGIAAFGASAKAAQLEGSKSFAREFCARHAIPQPAFAHFDKLEPAMAHIKEHYNKSGCVIKADGLAAGKGVVVADNEDEALAAVEEMLGKGKFGEAGANIVIEERITGIEASLFALVDGTNAIFLGSAQDYKRAHDGDKGDNTGGMGAVSPAPALSDALQEQAWQEIVLPVVKGMAEEGRPYRGFLYCGLMITQKGAEVIEFNCRFGDPEAEVILPRLKSDLLTALLTATKGGLGHASMQFDERPALTVMMVNGGYPGAYQKGAVISGLDTTQEEDTFIFHAGTAKNDSGQIIATGGRVLAVTALADDIKSARKKTYERVGSINWQDCFYRKDIGKGF